MCIIGIREVSSKVAFDKLEPEIRESFRCNSHGAGVAWVDKKRVHWIKGIQNADALVKMCHKLQETVGGYIFHCRIATHGGQMAGLTHPFPVCNDYDAMRKLSGSSEKGVLFHNGIFNWAKQKPEISDTMQFVKDYVHGCWTMWTSKSKITELVGSNCGSRVVILTPKDLLNYGDWQQSKDSGVWYSNGGYKSYANFVFRYNNKEEETPKIKEGDTSWYKAYKANQDKLRWTCQECWQDNPTSVSVCVHCKEKRTFGGYGYEF